MKISFKDLSMIKEINLPEIIKSYGIPEGNRTNGTYSFKCPFHPDNNPSLKVNQKGSKMAVALFWLRGRREYYKLCC